MTPEEIQSALAEPFPADAVGWKPQAVSGSRALAIAYIDARNVMDRLDSVVGVANWQDAYTPLPDGNVVCTLSLRIGGEWISKTDIGGPSDQRDSGDKEKAAFSDALKRAAVKFGVGRYLYSLAGDWVDFDPKKKQLVGTPRLPDWALPKPKGAAKPAAKAPAEKPAPEPEKPANGSKPPPQNWSDLAAALGDMDHWALRKGLAKGGEVHEQVAGYADEQLYPSDRAEWDEVQCRAAYAWAKDWLQRRQAERAREKAK